MTLAILVAAAFCVVIGVAVLVANPQRFSSQACAIGAFLVGAWLVSVYGAINAEAAYFAGTPANPFTWLKVNGFIIALWPWSVRLMQQSLITDQRDRRATVQRSLAWLVLPVAEAFLCEHPKYAFVDTAGRLVRGWPYYVFVVGLCSFAVALTVGTWRQMRKQRGIRRVEMQFLALNVGFGGVWAGTLVVLGNLLHLLSLKFLAVAFLVGPYALTAWAVTVYRIFDARHVLASLGQRIGAIAVIAIVAILIQPWLQPVLTPGERVVATIALGCAAILWLDRKSRAWLGLDGRRSLVRLRSMVIDISRREAAVETLVEKFETVLRAECQTETATLIAEPHDRAERRGALGDGLNLVALTELGWVTPESLNRRRSVSKVAALRAYVEKHSLGLLIAVPRGSPAPSLIVALGIKKNRGPFTYPEVERLMTIAELMDNILARSRLTTQAALQAKTEHVAMMSRGLAHDLNNLITPISSFLLHIDGHFPAGSVQADVHGHASRSIKVMQDYVRDAMFFGKQLAPKFTSVDVETVFRAVRELTQPRAAPRGIRVVAAAAGGLSVTADALLIQRLLVNLVNNAIDASGPEDAVTLAAKPRSAGRISLEVRDEGCGIPPENLSRVFEPYFTTKQFGDEVRGFGLGLSICRKIVDLHHGTIAIESQVGHGTSIVVELPGHAAS